MKKTEIIKKYTELFGKRPTLNIDAHLSDEEKQQIKKDTKINQFVWSLKKQMFTEFVEKSDIVDTEIKVIEAKSFIDTIKEKDLIKIYHGYSYSIDTKTKTYKLFQD